MMKEALLFCFLLSICFSDRITLSSPVLLDGTHYVRTNWDRDGPERDGAFIRINATGTSIYNTFSTTIEPISGVTKVGFRVYFLGSESVQGGARVDIDVWSPTNNDTYSLAGGGAPANGSEIEKDLGRTVDRVFNITLRFSSLQVSIDWIWLEGREPTTVPSTSTSSSTSAFTSTSSSTSRSTSTSAPITSTSATRTSTPTSTPTSATSRSTSTSIPITSTSATRTTAPLTSTSAPITSTSAPTTSTSATRTTFTPRTTTRTSTIASTSRVVNSQQTSDVSHSSIPNQSSSSSSSETSLLPVSEGVQNQNNGLAQNTIITIAGSVGGFFFLLVAILIAIFIVRRRKRVNNDDNEIPLSSEPPKSLLVGIEVKEKLGSGNFGEVYRGIYRENEVALKTVKDKKGLESFLNESKMLSKLHHSNIVQYMGAFVDSNGTAFMVMEYLPLGSLDRYVKTQPVSSDDMTVMAKHIVAGMCHLENSKIIHRDLALRNVLVGSDKGKIFFKISDFGMSVVAVGSVYQSDNDVPIRWSSPEVLDKGLFSHKSDVYSYGIVLWEIWSKAQLPYSEYSNETAKNMIMKGVTPTMPPKCSKEAWEVMQSCWKFEPAQRPSFAFLKAELEKKFILKDPNYGGFPGLVNNSEYGSFAMTKAVDENLINYGPFPHGKKR
eukprot:TRINITY_DN2831_c0_g1_i3.p1 TRINITY_DN2831_c0_g1~~TRINITY_DN2831_c0_g1_i3.p1  ORF type:complete len:664 (-),score=133.62 TRINITY_DN2831_c0_g1_i3:48-2039(-)